MKCAIFGDVHANLEALTVVLADIEAEKPDAVYCTGDVVGYGADPTKCLEIVRALGCPIVAGNHEYAVVGKTDITYFNREAMEGVMWTRGQLNEAEVTYIRNMALTAEVEGGILVHSTPAGPEGFGYIFTVPDAMRAFNCMGPGVCFVGHSHIPITFWVEDGIKYDTESQIDLSKAEKALVNVGSVGQPRDHDPRAAYALYDTEAKSLEIRRLDYDYGAASRKIMAAGLPESNAYRIAVGQ